jgi:hypothetical protein
MYLSLKFSDRYVSYKWLNKIETVKYYMYDGNALAKKMPF